MGLSRADAEALDRADPLAAFRDRFVVADPDLCYLDGNSLGRLPKATVARLRQVVEQEWGRGLVRSWEDWFDLPARVGEAIAPLVGSGPGQVVVTDSVTVDLHALVDAACTLRPGRTVLVVPAGEFPTDRYVVAGVAAARGLEVRHDLSALDADVAVVVASAVDFRTGELLDVAGLVRRAHAVGALVCVDLSHAAGSVPVHLDADGVDLAVGCTYKHLCGGPGAPAFLYVRRELQPELRRPQWGWWAQQDQFAMGERFRPHDDARRFLAGTPHVLGLAAVEEGVRLVAEAGIDAIRAKAVALGELAVALADERLAPLGFTLVSPRDPERRGAHLALAHPQAAAIGVAARELAGVVPDVRPPDLLRLGFAALTTSYLEVFDGIERIARLVEDGRHRPYVGGTAPRVT